jgi:hypothetical protein
VLLLSSTLHTLDCDWPWRNVHRRFADALEVAAETKAIEVEGAQNIQITIMG